MKVAVLGANGQVGAELCLILGQQSGLEIVPICRSRMGSAFLRSQGLRCRHGQIAIRDEALKLIGDCEIVANLALVNTVRNPRGAKQVNASILRNVSECLPRGGRHIYFSTMSVYGDAEVGQMWPIRNSYGQAKHLSEKVALREGLRRNLDTHVFRLGHVTGELQGISHQIRADLSGGPIAMPDPERLSNTVHVAAIADAILQVAASRIQPGTYDLMNVPQWTWREVYEYEGCMLGLIPAFQRVPERHSLRGTFRQLAGGATRTLSESAWIRRLGSRVLPLLPDARYRRIKALYSIHAAGQDIARLAPRVAAMDAVFRKPVGAHFAPGLTPTRQVLDDPSFRFPHGPIGPPWPRDLALHQATD